MDGTGNFSRAFWVARSGFGKSPDFPPIVSAGVDRDVMLDGKRICPAR